MMWAAYLAGVATLPAVGLLVWGTITLIDYVNDHVIRFVRPASNVILPDRRVWRIRPLLLAVRCGHGVVIARIPSPLQRLADRLPVIDVERRDPPQPRRRPPSPALGKGVRGAGEGTHGRGRRGE